MAVKPISSFLIEDGGEGQHIHRMSGRPVGVGSEDEVTGFEVFDADEFHGFLESVVIAAGEDGQAGCFGQQAAVLVINAEAKVADFIDDGGIGGAHEVAFHLPRRREVIIMYDLDGDRIQGQTYPLKRLDLSVRVFQARKAAVAASSTAQFTVSITTP